jgi:plasmid stabilization system protein ParE
MKNFKVFLTSEARSDLKNISFYISDVLKAPMTSKIYAQGLVAEINKLSSVALSLPSVHFKQILQYGINARRINYKKPAIIYTVKQETVIIRRIIVASLIKE